MRDAVDDLAITRWHLSALALIIVAGVALRLLYINQPMRYDEAFSYLFFVRVPLASTLSDYTVPNQHILNSLLMRLSAHMFGHAPWALRFSAFLFGIAIIPAVFYALRHLVGSRAALLASGFAAVSSPLILYSTNARGYSLVVLLFLCAIWLSASGRLSHSSGAWKALVVISVAGLYTVPIMLYAIGGIWLWHGAQAWLLWRRSADRKLLECVTWHAAAAGMLTAMLYAPVMIGTGLGSLVANDWVTARAPAQFVSELPALLRDLWRGWHAGMPVLLGWLLGAGFFAFLLLGRKQLAHGTVLAAVAAWCCALLLFTMRAPFPRVFLFLLPLYLAFAVAGILAVAERATVPARLSYLAGYALCAWCGLSVVKSEAVRRIEGPLFPDAPAVVSYLAQTVREGDGVYARTPADAPIWYYTWRSGLSDSMLRLKYNARSRVLIIVNGSDGQTIERVLQEAGLERMRFSPPVLRYSTQRARVYELRRLPYRLPATSKAAGTPNPVSRPRAAAASSATSATG
jgi:hypothetical protein